MTAPSPNSRAVQRRFPGSDLTRQPHVWWDRHQLDGETFLAAFVAGELVVPHPDTGVPAMWTKGHREALPSTVVDRFRAVWPAGENLPPWPGHELLAAGSAAVSDVTAPSDELEHWVEPLDWPTFMAEADDHASEWLAEPLLPVGAQVAIWARAKVGKSLLLLDVSYCLACGLPVLGGSPNDAVDVIYIDLENPARDVRDRVFDLGYGATSDLSRLHYFHIPALPPLDTDLGGAVLAAQVERFGAALVVVDTTASSVGGGENDADTYRAFYRHTGRRLRAAGVTLARLDHGGKDRTKGQRGSSAKDDDVDLVFEMTDAGEHLVLRRTRSRFPWVPPEVRFTRREEPVLRHVVVDTATPAGTLEVVKLLDTLGLPVQTSVRVAMTALRDSGNGRRRDLVAAALKHRRYHP